MRSIAGSPGICGTEAHGEEAEMVPGSWEGPAGHGEELPLAYSEGHGAICRAGSKMTDAK